MTGLRTAMPLGAPDRLHTDDRESVAGVRVGARFAIVTVRYLLARLEGHYGLIVQADED